MRRSWCRSVEKPLGQQDAQLFDKYGLPCGRHHCLLDCKKPDDTPRYICKGDKIYKQVGTARHYQEMK